MTLDHALGPSVSDDETARQAALDEYGILDTLDEQAYDDITQLAAAICATPTALISFVDRDRQWFKAKVGLAARQTPRTMSFCAHAIRTPEQVMIVPDALQDPRFADNPLVTDTPLIRFYAGAPLVTPRGAALGTICVIDKDTNNLSATQVDALRILSRQVVAQLELRRVNAALETINDRLEAASMTDALTCVPNRRAFNARLAEENARIDRGGAPVSILMIDIDHFKSYNDRFGHLAGDEALFRVAQVLQASARPYDFLARYGGEEFVMVLPSTTLAAAAGVAERLRHEAASLELAHGAVTLSIGVAAKPGADTTELLQAADAALYRAKSGGRNRVMLA
jgi:diguanylate cyclase (GGDEF)-like protein